MKLNNYSL